MEQSVHRPQGGYANLTNDYMFKRVFGSEECKDILIAFLNGIFPDDGIYDVSFLNNERLGPTSYDRKAVFDVFVRSQSGGEFIIEMQVASQEHFRERLLFYACYPIINQAELAREHFREANDGDLAGFRWDFNLNPVRVLAVLNFKVSHGKVWNPLKYDSQFMIREESTSEILHDKLSFTLLELPRFDKSVDELDTYYDKWLYLLKNMPVLRGRPGNFEGSEFDHLFEMAELCKFTPEQLTGYQESQNMIYDYENTIDYARKQGLEQGLEQGLAKGKAEGILSVARNMLAARMPIGQICSLTGLGESDILAISRKEA